MKMDPLIARALLEDDPFVKALLQAGYFQYEEGWMKRIGVYLVIIKKMPYSGKWEQFFYFKGPKPEPLCWTSNVIDIEQSSDDIVRELLHNEEYGHRQMLGHEILGMPHKERETTDD